MPKPKTQAEAAALGFLKRGEPKRSHKSIGPYKFVTIEKPSSNFLNKVDLLPEFALRKELLKTIKGTRRRLKNQLNRALVKSKSKTQNLDFFECFESLNPREKDSLRKYLNVSSQLINACEIALSILEGSLHRLTTRKTNKRFSSPLPYYSQSVINLANTMQTIGMFQQMIATLSYEKDLLKGMRISRSLKIGRIKEYGSKSTIAKKDKQIREVFEKIQKESPTWSKSRIYKKMIKEDPSLNEIRIRRSIEGRYNKK